MGCCTSSEAVNTQQPRKKDGVSQVFLLGLDGSGKTTLLYRTHIPNWTDITSHMEKTVGFHYEEITRHGLTVGVWDLPGSETLRQLWPMFYKWISVSAVVFVVNLTDTQEHRIAEARRVLRILVNEDELRDAFFAVVFNTHDMEGTPAMMRPEEMFRCLGLLDPSIVHKGIRTYTVNVKNGVLDPQWHRCLTHIANHIRQIDEFRPTS